MATTQNNPPQTVGDTLRQRASLKLTTFTGFAEDLIRNLPSILSAIAQMGWFMFTVDMRLECGEIAKKGMKLSWLLRETQSEINFPQDYTDNQRGKVALQGLLNRWYKKFCVEAGKPIGDWCADNDLKYDSEFVNGVVYGYITWIESDVRESATTEEQRHGGKRK